MFTDAEKRALVETARIAVAGHLGQRGAARVDVSAADLPSACGVFVTLKRNGDLRGCIGTLECRRPLAEEVARCAVNAASEDPRFQPVRVSELDDLSVEVSILGALERIDPLDPDAILVGRHGLVVEQGSSWGLLLPQVATEWGWDRDTFLSHTCRKAGLPPDAWKHGALVYRFEAEVFGE